MESLSIILRRPPYGTIDAPEAIRHALGGITEDVTVKLVLVDGGVNTARKKQDSSNTEYLNAGEGINDCIDMGGEVYADTRSIKEEHIEAEDIIDGVIMANSSEIAEIIKNSETTMIF